MPTEFITRRAALKYASLITLAAQGWPTMLSAAAPVSARGYGTDPDLLKRPVTWPRTLTAPQLKALAALCDIILPADTPHPSAAAIGVHEFLDEWVSAPYPPMQADRIVILGGLIALDEAIRRQQDLAFSEADVSRQTAVFEQLCGEESTMGFARRLIELVCAGYYTTREGHAAIGYVGNVALTHFPPPTAEIVQHLERALGDLPAPRASSDRPLPLTYSRESS
jgi:Gluconate 2-dehydrogenase subunit 3